MQTGNGSSPTGQGRERGRGTHPCHGIGHCGEITPFIDSLASIVIVLVIRKVCRGGYQVGWVRASDGGGRSEKYGEADRKGKVQRRKSRKEDREKYILLFKYKVYLNIKSTM